MCPSDFGDDEILFADDGENEAGVEQQTSRVWHILIVDDDPEIHSVTKLALNDLIAFDGSLQFHHAYSGAEAIDYISKHEEISIILLDVVMETEDAGLRVAKHIREEFNMHDVRIILRTGQPGYAPEENIVKDYDINDYKTKTELTRSKLVTTIISSLRSYLQIKTINENRVGLEKVVRQSGELLKQHTPATFANTAIQHLCSLLNIPASGLLCANTYSQHYNQQDAIVIHGATNSYSQFIGRSLIDCDDGRAINQISKCFNSTEHYFSEHESVFFVRGVSQQAVVYLDEGKEHYSETELQLLDVYLANLVVALDNINLLSQLSNAAYCDWLTGLANRTEFTRMLDDFSRHNNADEAVVVIDIDHFSDINDGLGQEIGNEMLISIAKRLKEELSEDCKIARVSADVFGVIGKEQDIQPEDIFAIFENPFKAGEHQIPINVTMGVCQQNQADKNGLAIMKQAYIALNRAKRHSQAKVEYYSHDMEEQTACRLGMIRQLRTDFEARKLEVWYQPQFCLETNKMVGMESLLRWPTGDGNYISPATFVPLAEHSGLIVDIGAWVVEESCRQLRQLDELLKNNLRISVNVSMPQFRSPKFAESVISTVERMAIEPSRFELEITESVIMDEPQMVIDTLNEIKKSGIKVAIDDFGTGFSSLSYLQRLPLDRIKVDRAFVRDMHNANGAVIAEMIVNLGKNLGLATIAEGIETPEQEAGLKALGCEEVQGFKYAKPMPAKDLQAFIQSHFDK